MARGNNLENIVDIDCWAASLARALDDVPQYMCMAGHPGRIGRIPENLREADIKAYEPFFLSIGPYHHGKQRVQRMEKRKWVVLKCFLAQNQELQIKDYLKEIKSIEQAVRGFYSEVEMDSKTFLQMLLLDSLFILPIFCGFPSGPQKNVEDGCRLDKGEIEILNKEVLKLQDNGVDTQMIAKAEELNDDTSEENTDEGERWVWSMLTQDLFLLENQLPFFVLEKIHCLAYGNSETNLLSIMKGKIGMLLSDYVKLDSEMDLPENEEIHHILHLCHLFFRPKLQNECSSSQFPETNQMFRLGCAVQLYEAGVNFEARSDSNRHSLLDISFDRSGKLTMPHLHVDDRINSLLRNLIAFEQMKYPTLGLHVSAYIVLLLHLITTPNDVQLLRRKGILQHHLPSDKEMMRFVNRLSVGLSFDYVEDEYTLKPVFQELKSYSERRRPRWRAWVKRKYFNNPWTTISLIAASLLLVLSLVQTYYTVYSYYHPLFDGHS